jgi:hypothetical protein
MTITLLAIDLFIFDSTERIALTGPIARFQLRQRSAWVTIFCFAARELLPKA